MQDPSDPLTPPDEGAGSGDAESTSGHGGGRTLAFQGVALVLVGLQVAIFSSSFNAPQTFEDGKFTPLTASNMQRSDPSSFGTKFRPHSPLTINATSNLTNRKLIDDEQGSANDRPITDQQSTKNAGQKKKKPISKEEPPPPLDVSQPTSRGGDNGASAAGVEEDSIDNDGDTITKERTKQRQLFCYAVVMSPPEPTLDLVVESMQKCDGYMLFSNFSDPRSNILDLIKDNMKVPYGGEWRSALNTPHFWKVWQYMAKSPTIAEYEWFVKIDMDTLLLPENLKALLKNEGEDYKQVVMWGDPIPGPCEVFSQGALKAFGARHKDECDGGSLDMRKEWPQEDMYIYKCLQALGSRNVEPRGDWRFDGHLTSNAKTLEQLKAGNKLVCYSEPGAPDSRFEIQNSLSQRSSVAAK